VLVYNRGPLAQGQFETVARIPGQPPLVTPQPNRCGACPCDWRRPIWPGIPIYPCTWRPCTADSARP